MNSRQKQALATFNKDLQQALRELAEAFPLPDATTWADGIWETEPAEPEECCQHVTVSVRIGDGKQVHSIDVSLI